MRVFFINLNKKKIFITILIVFIIFSSVISLLKSDTITTSLSKDQLTEELKQMFKIRDAATINGDTESIKALFDMSVKVGTWAYEHEKTRTGYLNSWAKIRNVKFTEMSSDLKIERVNEKGGSIWIDFLHSAKFTYIYPKKPNQPQSFGIGSRRAIELVKKDNRWIVKREWYLDPFENTLEIPPELQNYLQPETNQTPPAIANSLNFFRFEAVPASTTTSQKRYDREKAAAYADKYSGATFGSGNGWRYNKRYRDFTYLGGDCTNFISQVLGDKEEGGGLQTDGGWFYSFGYKGVGGGTQSWVMAAALKSHLLYSGKAELVTRGTLAEVSMPSPQFPEGAFKKLQLGDLACYEDKGAIDHFSVITGFDPEGLPLVNSHTTDRYHVPWDLGWTSKNVRFLLIHIRD